MCQPPHRAGRAGCWRLKILPEIPSVQVHQGSLRSGLILRLLQYSGYSVRVGLLSLHSGSQGVELTGRLAWLCSDL